MHRLNLKNLDNEFYSKTYSFLPDTEKDAYGENLMTQSLIIQQPYRRIRHPELTPVILGVKDAKDIKEKNNTDIMSRSLIVPPYRRTRHSELTPVILKERETPIRKNEDIKKSTNKIPKRAFSMTRLDQLAKPRQRYVEEALKIRASLTKETMISTTRPTSSMSLAPKQLSPVNNSNNSNGTILLRNRSATKKARPLSYAGSTISSSNHMTEKFNRLSVKAKPTYGNLSNQKIMNSGSSSRHSLVNSTDGSFISTPNYKPIPPKKPAHIKAAAAARKQAKQEETEKIKKSQSSPRITIQNINDNFDKMKKSTTNPNITEVIEEKESDSSYEKNDTLETSLIDIKSFDESLNNKTVNEEIKINNLDKESSPQKSFIKSSVSNENISNKEEEEEQLKKENDEITKKFLIEEEKTRIAREELEKKTKEKAEKARLEMEERLKKDEEERIARKKRLNAIMSRTRKNQDNAKINSLNTENLQSSEQNSQQDFIESVANKLIIEQNQLKQNLDIKPDVVEDAIKSNLINLTKNDNLNKNDLHNYLENENLIENKNRLVNGFKEMKMNASSTFVFSAQASNETFTPGAN